MSKCGQDRVEEIVKLTQSLIDRDELADKLGMTSQYLSRVINLMRVQGHEIWVINTGIKEFSVIYKGYEQPKEKSEPEIGMRFV